MPIYEYKCAKCGNELEVMQKVSDPAPAECPQCHEQHSLERLMSRTSFQLKGGGWYADLYGSAKKSESSTASSGSATGTSGATSSSSAAPAAGSGSTASSSPAPASSGASSSSTSSGGSGGGSSGSST